MRHKLLRAFVIVTAPLLALGAGSAEADSKTAPYYATPSWDQQLPASTRFVVLPNWIDANFPSGGAAVLDKETGLVWERSPDATQAPWPAAQFACLNKNVGGRGGWKLPNIQELRSLVDSAATAPALPAGHPFTNVQLSYYWSATTEVTDTSIGADDTLARAVNFFGGSVDNPSLAKTVPLYVWCVRGGSGSDTQ